VRRQIVLPIVVLLVGLGVFLVAGHDRAAPADRTMVLATTTSTDNSGLLKYLLDPWEKETGIDVKVIAVGTGKAIRLAEHGDADLVLVHARSREDAFVASGHGMDRRDVMWNDFVILGPSEDPAHLKGLHDAAEALRRIAKAKAPFVSRADDSGTNIREKAIWKAAGVQPSGAWYLKAGQGMGACLTIADQRAAYILADRGTWLSVRHSKKHLVLLVEGDTRLHNPYGVILVNPAKHPKVHLVPARKLRDFLVSPEGQRRIGAYRVDGEVLFHPSAAGD
jgi:tungstate transport system substrate-binding protein